MHDAPSEAVEQNDADADAKKATVNKPVEAQPVIKEPKRKENIQKKKTVTDNEKSRVSPAAKKIIKTKKAQEKRVPKAVMPPQTDY